MTLGAYMRDKAVTLALNAVGLLLLSLYLLALKNSQTTVVLIAVVWLFTLLALLLAGYHSRRRYFARIHDLMEHLEQPYLIAEFLEPAWRPEDRLYRDVLYRAGKAATERVEAQNDAQKEYREFIEGWIHEVKLPITGIQLAYHNEKRGGDRKIEAYLAELDNAVERVLFYARSDQVYKDYQVAQTDLRQTVLNAVARGKYLLIQNGMAVRVECGGERVVTDKKWLEFILAQLIANAVKYKKEAGGELVFTTEDAADAVRLRVRDTGIGIPPAELGRVFEKGFTGSNGRGREKSTGFGLYLCAKLCKKLEIGIGAASAPGEYTEITLAFPKNTYLSKL